MLLPQIFNSHMLVMDTVMVQFLGGVFKKKLSCGEIQLLKIYGS